MAIEEPLYRDHLRKLLRTKVDRMSAFQEFTAFHMDLLVRGDRKTRLYFRYLQSWYMWVLNLSIPQFRESIHPVDIRELEGFSVEPISRKPKSEDKTDEDDAGELKVGEEACGDHSDDDNDRNSDSANDISNDTPELVSVDEDPSKNPPLGAIASFNTQDTLFPRLNPFRYEVEYPIARWSLPSPGEHNNKQEVLNHGSCPRLNPFRYEVGYPKARWSLPSPGEHNNEQEVLNHVSFEWTRRTVPFWTGAVQEAQQEEESGGLESPSSVSEDLSSGFSLDTPECVSQQSSSPHCGPEDRPLSKELRNLLERIGADANVTRTNRVVTLTPAELAKRQSCWESKVIATKIHEAGKRRRREPHPRETDLLNTWDDKLGQYYWQTEGLFLCRLVELVHKNSFESARACRWADKLTEVKQPRHKKRKRPLPSSPLKNELSM
ncbi:hypothetical protein F4801DRAFT_597787 [Xylaria longipes]|nr:hypothetical protein F4801DRAFT_597787 [Xylaria longipes]RYC55835.1 hypothetical protein CHU98_g10375 [Xylaria longipes]